MINKKSIVILLSTYNGEKYLNQQLNSIWKQNTTAKIQIYFRDDGSNDATLAIIEDWKKRLDIIESIDSRKKNLGPANSFWSLLTTAPKADYYAFCDQDDIWYPNKIESALSKLNLSEDPALFCSNCNVIDSYNQIIDYSYQRTSPLLTMESQLVCGSMQGCSMVFNRLLLTRIKSYNLTCIPMHDIIVILHASIIGKIIYDDTILFGYRMHANNVVAKGKKNFYRKFKSTLNLWINNGKTFPISSIANDLLINHIEYLSKFEIQYLEDLIGSKKNFIKRLHIIFNNKTMSSNKKGLRSFKIRILLGLI